MTREVRRARGWRAVLVDARFWTVIGTVAIFVLFDRVASYLGSVRGERGLTVCAVVVVATVWMEWSLSRRDLRASLRAIGLGAPIPRALGMSVALSLAMLGFFPAYAALSGETLRVRDDWLALLPGLFAQAGIAEEVLFRGFLFRRVRGEGSFARGAARAVLPFALAHVVLLFSMDASVALVAVLLSITISIPLSWLFERGGGAVWPAAVLHCTVQGSIKVVETDGSAIQLAIAWMAFAAVAPFIVFSLRPRPSEGA
ncbi:MAG: CPBP family intramembrane glutamic endopeptidase [Sandaracinaceae bacterium]